MRRAKALLPFDEQPLIVHIVRALKDIFSERVVVVAPEQELPSLPARLVRAEISYQGPVGGIYYGLREADRPFSFVTSCDVAFLNIALISHRIISYNKSQNTMLSYPTGRNVFSHCTRSIVQTWHHCSESSWTGEN